MEGAKDMIRKPTTCKYCTLRGGRMVSQDGVAESEEEKRTAGSSGGGTRERDDGERDDRERDDGERF